MYKGLRNIVQVHNGNLSLKPLYGKQYKNKTIFFFDKNIKDIKENDMIEIIEYTERKSIKDPNLDIITITKCEKVKYISNTEKVNNKIKVEYTCGNNIYEEYVDIVKKEIVPVSLSYLYPFSSEREDYYNYEIPIKYRYLFYFNGKKEYYYDKEYTLKKVIDIDLFDKDILEQHIDECISKYVENIKKNEEIQRKLNDILSTHDDFKKFININLYEIKYIENIKIFEHEYDIRDPYEDIWMDVINVNGFKFYFNISSVDEDYIIFKSIKLKDIEIEEKSIIDFFENFLAYLHFSTKTRNEHFIRGILSLPEINDIEILKEVRMCYNISTDDPIYLSNEKKFNEYLEEYRNLPDNKKIHFEDEFIKIIEEKKYELHFKRIIDIEEGVGARDNTIIDTSYSCFYIEMTPTYEIIVKSSLVSDFVIEHIDNYYNRKINI